MGRFGVAARRARAGYAAGGGVALPERISLSRSTSTSSASSFSPFAFCRARSFGAQDVDLAVQHAALVGDLVLLGLEVGDHLPKSLSTAS